jgi:hypothetical protein
MMDPLPTPEEVEASGEVLFQSQAGGRRVVGMESCVVKYSGTSVYMNEADSISFVSTNGTFTGQ